MRIADLRFRSIAALTAFVALTQEAAAGLGFPSPWQLGLQDAASGGAESVHSFHDFLLWITTVITLFVLALLLYVMVRFNEKRNPVPTRTTHNTLLEVAWTLVPALILVVIAIPSFRILKTQLVLPEPDIVVKASAHQWYWCYTYPSEQVAESAGTPPSCGDEGRSLTFESKMVDKDNLKPDQIWLLSAQQEMVVPVDKIVRVQVTAADVIHAFAMPAFGLKLDAVPGRLNETWFKAEKEGLFHGQCSLICGELHAYMPINIRVVSEEKYLAWLTEKKKSASLDAGPVKLAGADSPAR